MLEIKKHCIINADFDEFISRLNTAEERINKLKSRSKGTSQTELQREKNKNKTTVVTKTTIKQ